MKRGVWKTYVLPSNDFRALQSAWQSFDSEKLSHHVMNFTGSPTQIVETNLPQAKLRQLFRWAGVESRWQNFVSDDVPSWEKEEC
jgi:hypothetical protein